MAALEKTVACPGCGGDSVYATHNAYRPFCSARCKNLDLGAWASESFRMPAQDSAEDLPEDPAEDRAQASPHGAPFGAGKLLN